MDLNGTQQVDDSSESFEDSVLNSLSVLSIEQGNGDTSNDNNDSRDTISISPSANNANNNLEINKDNRSLLMLTTTLSYWLKFCVLPTVPTIEGICETLRQQNLGISETGNKYDPSENAVFPVKLSDLAISEEEKILCNNDSETHDSCLAGASGSLGKRIASDNDQVNFDHESSEGGSPLAKKSKFE